MSLSGLPLPYNIAALGIAIMDPCTKQAKAPTSNLNGVLCSNTLALDLEPQYIGGDELESETADGKIFRALELPKDAKYAKGSLKVSVFNPEILALIEGSALFTASATTRGGQERPKGGTTQFVWIQAYERLDYGDSCPAAGTPLFRVHVMPYVKFESKPAGMKKGYREAEADLVSYPLLPPSYAATTRSVTTVNADATITVTTGTTVGLGVGQAVSGTGIPADATIASITDSTHFELSAAATAAGTGVTLTIGAGAYLGPFGDLPQSFWTAFTLPSWKYWADLTALPAGATACDTLIAVT